MFIVENLEVWKTRPYWTSRRNRFKNVHNPVSQWYDLEFGCKSHPSRLLFCLFLKNASGSDV